MLETFFVVLLPLLGADDFETRESAQAVLTASLAFGRPPAALLKAAGHPDPEVVWRARAVLRSYRAVSTDLPPIWFFAKHPYAVFARQHEAGELVLSCLDTLFDEEGAFTYDDDAGAQASALLVDKMFDSGMSRAAVVREVEQAIGRYVFFKQNARYKDEPR